HSQQRVWQLRHLPRRDAAEAHGSRAVGQTLYRLPGKDGTGPAIASSLGYSLPISYITRVYWWRPCPSDYDHACSFFSTFAAPLAGEFLRRACHGAFPRGVPSMRPAFDGRPPSSRLRHLPFLLSANPSGKLHALRAAGHVRPGISKGYFLLPRLPAAPVRLSARAQLWLLRRDTRAR